MRYIVVGLSNIALDIGLLNLAVRITGVTKGPLLILFASLSLLIAVINSYYWNGRWTFRVKLSWKDQFPRFLGTNIVGLAINDMVIYVLTAFPHPWIGQSAVLHVNEAKIVAVGAAALWNFSMYRWFVFRSAYP